jgi:hypothetical protein
LKIDQTTRLKNLEQKNVRLHRASSDALIDNQILRDQYMANSQHVSVSSSKQFAASHESLQR